MSGIDWSWLTEGKARPQGGYKRGRLRVPKEMTVKAWLAGGSVSHGVHTLGVGGREVGSVGDDTQKSRVFALRMRQGEHAVEWVLTGGRFGNNLLRFEDPATGKLLPLSFSADDLEDFKAFPAKDVVHVTSEERGWPIPLDW